MESAWLYNDMEFLRNEWEYYVLAELVGDDTED